MSTEDQPVGALQLVVDMCVRLGSAGLIVILFLLFGNNAYHMCSVPQGLLCRLVCVVESILVQHPSGAGIARFE